MDLASLSFSIDSSQAVKAKDDLDKLRGSSVDATDQALRLTRAFLDGKDPLAAYRAELALMDTSMRNVGVGIDALVDRVRLMGATFSGAVGPTKEFSQAMGQLQAAAAMFDSSTRALEQFVRTTREFGVSSQEMQRGLERIQAALQGIGTEGQRARDILRNYGVNLAGRGPNDAAAVYREFVESARNFRMDVNTYDDYRSVVGNLSIQSFAGLRDPAFRTTAQRQRELDASEQAGQVAALREQAFTIGRGTNRWQNQLADLEAEYGGTARDRAFNIATFGLGGVFQSADARRAELEQRRASGVMGNTAYYRNRAPEGQGFDSAYLADVDAMFGSLAMRQGLGFGGRLLALGGDVARASMQFDWLGSDVFSANRDVIGAMYRDERAREGLIPNLFGDNALYRRIGREVNNFNRQYVAPPMSERSAVNRLVSYGAETDVLNLLRPEATDPEATALRQLYRDALQAAGRTVPEADRMPITELERQFSAPELEIVRNRRSALDARTVDQMLGVGPSMTAPGGREPFAMARRRDGLARFGYSLDGVDVGAPGSENATWDREAERSRQIAQIVADAEAKALEPLDRKRLIKERIAELDRQEADRAAEAVSRSNRDTQQAQNLLNFINQSQSLIGDPAAFGGEIRGFMANEQAQGSPKQAQILLRTQANQLIRGLEGRQTQSSAALGRAEEMRALLEGGASQYEADREMAIRDQLRPMREIASQLDEEIGKRSELLELIERTEKTLREMSNAQRQQFLGNENTTLNAATARLTADRARLAALQNDPETRRREDRIIAEARARDPDLRDRSGPDILNILRSSNNGQRYRDYAGFADQRFGLESDRRFSDYLEQSQIAIGNSSRYRAYLGGGNQGQDNLYAAAMMILEAGRDPTQQFGVGNVINRRMRMAGGASAFDIISTPSQFEPWATRQPELRALMEDPNSPAMRAALDRWMAIRAGEAPDPSNGATHFLNPSVVRSRTGGSLPGFAQGQPTAVIGPHSYYGGNFRMPERRTVEGATVDASLDAAAAEFRRNNPANPAREAEYLNIEVMRRASEALDRLATNAARAGDQLSQMEAQARMTPAERAEAQALQGIEPDVRTLRALRDRATDPAAQVQIDAEIAAAQQGARDTARRRLGVNFIAEERGINNQLTDAEFMADSWWMSGERRQREFTRQREARRMREEFGMDENSPGWNERLDKVGRIAEYNEIARQNQMIRDSFLQIGNAAGTALDQIILKGGNARQVMAALLSSMASNFVRLGFNQLFSTGLDGAGSLFRSLFSGGTNAAVSTSATNAALASGAMDSSGALLPFAQGGALIRSPTYFPMANGGTALAGEAGQEAIFPLARDSRGRLGLVGGGGGGTNITVNITTQGSSGNAASDAKAAEQIGRMVRAELEKMMTDKMRDQMRPGGMFNGGGQPVYS
jgi:hypothetical protein